MILKGSSVSERRYLRSIAARVRNFVRYMDRVDKRRLLLVLDRTHKKRPGKKSHHQASGYYQDEIIAYMARKGLL